MLRWHCSRLITLGLLCWTMAACKHQHTLMPTPSVYLLNPEVDPFAEVPPEQRTSAVRLLYATDRVPATDKDGAFGYGWERSPSLAFGRCTLQIGEPDLSWEDLVRASRTAKREVELPLSVTSIEELGRGAATPHVSEQDVADQARMNAVFLAELRARLAQSPRKEAFVFIHGYHNSFVASARVAGELWHFLGREGVPIFYTWPSGHGGLLQGYEYDGESASFTVYHFKTFLKLLASCEELESISIMSHSRGTQVVVDAVREMFIAARAAGRNPRESCKLNNVVLAAADIDIEVVLQRVATEALGGARRTTAYISHTDKALSISGWLFADRRLGRLDYDDLTDFERAVVARSHSASLVDNRVHTKGVGHNYFHSVPAVSSDLVLVLRYNRDPGAANGRPLTQVGPNYWELADSYPEGAELQNSQPR